MRFAVLLACCATVAAACSDDLSVVVDVTHPSPVARTVISVYQSDSVDCTKVEFGDLDGPALAATLIAEETFDGSGVLVSGDLKGLSRTAAKTIVARGYDEDGQLVAGGCAMKGVIKGQDHVAITTEHAMVISANPSDTDPYTINVLATTTEGVLLNKREVSWQVYAPIGSAPLVPALATVTGDAEWQPTATACTGVGGVAKIHPVPPSLIGGFATRIRASWAANALPFETALLKADTSMPFGLDPPPGTKHVCAVRIAGATRRLVCLDRVSGSPVARELMLTVATGRGVLASTGTTPVANPVGVLAKPGAAPGDQDVYVIDSAGQQVPVFGAPAPRFPTICAGCTVTDFLYAPACAPPDDKPRLVLALDTVLRVMSADGGPTLPVGPLASGALSAVELKAAGCVSVIGALTSKQVRSVVVADITVNGADPVAIGAYNCDSGTCNKLVLPVAGTGVAFATTPQGESRLVGPSLDATGLVISSWIIRPTNDNATHVDLLLERDRLPAAREPHKLLIGKLDDDDGYDLLWDIQGERATTVEIAYSRMAESQRLEVVSPLGTLTGADLLLEDLSGDGHPEVVIVGAIGTGTLGGTPVAVVPTHVAPAPTQTMAEDPCK